MGGTDCLNRLAYNFGKQLIPRQGKFESLYYALNLNDPSCTVEQPEPEVSPWTKVHTSPFSHVDVPAHAVVVAPGDSIQVALDLAAKRAKDTNEDPLVMLRGGTNYGTEQARLLTHVKVLTTSPKPSWLAPSTLV